MTDSADSVIGQSNNHQANPLAPPDADALQRIRERAFFLWQQDGCPDGQSEEYWERARELQAMTDSAGAGLKSVDAPDGNDVVDEAALEDNLGEFPDRLSDQGEHRSAPMTRAAEHAALKEGRRKRCVLRLRWR